MLQLKMNLSTVDCSDDCQLRRPTKNVFKLCRFSELHNSCRLEVEQKIEQKMCVSILKSYFCPS